jgi:hypothetical protein
MRWGHPTPRQGQQPLHPALQKLHIGLSSVDIERPEIRPYDLPAPASSLGVDGYVMPL